eukprot:5914-Heterococcus_DN1.PRE.2
MILESPAARDLPLAASSDCELIQQVYSGLRKPRVPFWHVTVANVTVAWGFALCRPQQMFVSFQWIYLLDG